MFPTRTHRRRALPIVAALTVGVGLMGYSQGGTATAVGPTMRVEVAATALKPAVRLSQIGVIPFPMNPLPKCALSKTSFGQPRPGGRIHEGVDIMATLGQEIYAVDNGTLTKQTIDGAANATLSGNAWTLKLTDGTYYFYAHLSKFADGLTQGSVVIRGQLIGYVGDTGDPGPGNYHLHFEVHPQGGAAVNPVPLLTIPKACQVFA